MRDREVVASITAGDPAGLAMAYDRYAPQLFAYCRSMLREPADAADAVQDTFVIAAARLKDLRQPDRLRSWLYAVARNVCLRKIKGEKKAAAFYPAVANAAEPAEDTEVGGRAELAELSALVRDAAGGLSARDREMLVLRLWQGLDPAEAGAALGVTRGYANALFARARAQLEVCVGVLLVARTGRRECTELRALLENWDGQLTVLLRKRLSRHVESCDTCGERRRRELVPALLGLGPIAALAAGAAADAGGHAGLIPAMVKGKALGAAAAGPGAAGTGAGGTSGAGSVVSQAGPFGKNGFPRPPHGAATWLGRGTRGQVTAAGGAVAVAAVVALVLALPGGAQHGRLASGGSPVPVGAGPSGTSPSGPATGGPAAGGGHGGSTPASGGHAVAGRGRTGAGPGLVAVFPRTTGSGVPGSSSATGSTGSTGSSGSGGSTGSGPTSGAGGGGTGTASSPPSGPTTPPPSTAPPTTPPPTTAPPTTPPTTPPPSGAPPGTLSVSTGTVVLTPLLGSTITLTATGGSVTWSVSEPASIIGTVAVYPSSGSLAAGHSTRLTITVRSLLSLDTSLDFYPGGIPVHVVLGLGL
jgi:RNA polymerase sigma factor (sigma-70 family)